MCYHFEDHDTQDYIDWFVKTHNLKAYYHLGVKYYVNAFDHLPSAVITQEQPDTFREMEWGFVPHWVKTIEQAHLERNKNLNARSETVLTSNNFRQAIIQRKCLIVASGFFEWRHITPKNKIPYLIGTKHPHHPDEFAPFMFGGIYNRWTDKDTGETIEGFAIVTTPANSMLATIHNSKLRMPLIVDEANHMKWLTSTDPEEIKAMMVPYPDHLMLAHPVSKLVSKKGVEKNVPEVIAGEQYPEVEFTEFL